MGSRRLAALVWFSGATLVASVAHANGAFPSAGQIILDPSNPDRVWVATTYGYARTTDGGASFQLICEGGIGYSSGFHPYGAVTPQGTLFVGLSDGLVVGRGDDCAFERAGELEGDFVVDVSVDTTGRALAVMVPSGGGRAQIWQSIDDATTWSKLGSDLGQTFTPLTVDASPADPSVLYVSGLDIDASVKGSLCTSMNDGNSWSCTDVPGSDRYENAPYIGAVDPDDPATVYVRVDGFGGHIFVSHDYGATLTPIATATGKLYAFKLSADGLTAWYGGNADGLHSLNTTTLADSKLSDVRARCAQLDGDDLLVCGDEPVDGFAVGRSTDGGSTFTPFLLNRCIEGIVPCEASTPVAMTCDAEWPAIKSLLGPGDDCVSGAGGSNASAGGSTASRGGSPPGAGGSGHGASDASGGGGAASDGSSDGCDCAAAPGEGRRAPAILLLAIAPIILGYRRRRARCLPRPGAAL